MNRPSMPTGRGFASGLVALALAWGWAGGLAAVGADTPVPLWPGRPPGPEVTLPPEADLTKPTENLVAGRRLIRLGNVAEPTLQVFRPPAGKEIGAAVLVCPGGGYHILALDLEGSEVCEWLNSIGVTGVLLKYRVPKRVEQEKHLAPLQDAQRAMSLVRERAREFGIDPTRVGVLGFSAGGHLAAVLSASTNRAYAKLDGADAQEFRPTFSVLVYPAYLTVKEENDRISPELSVGAHTPPTFITVSADDPVRVEGPLHYTLALKQAGVPVELHVYPTGGHGYGLRRTANPVTFWPDRVADWMGSRGWLTRP